MMNQRHLLVFVVLCSIVISLVLSQKYQKLIMVNELFRHGARYPVYPKNSDGSGNYTFAQHSFGQLTTNGKKMHYLLGKKLYQTYWMALFKGTKYQRDYNQSKFYIKSTDVNRTIESVQSQMMGIFENLPALNLTQNMVEFSKPQWPGIESSAGDVFPEARTFHPIAIHVEKVGSDPFNSGDFLRTYSPDNCPNQKVWQHQNRNTAKVQQIIKNPRFVQALDKLSSQLGFVVSFWDSPAYFDNYQCALYMGRQFLKVYQNQEYRRSLYYIYTLDMYINLYSNPKQIRATATGFFNQTMHNMKAIIADKEAVQWNVYSAHDTTVGNMIAALNLTNVDCIYDAFVNNQDVNTDTCITQYPHYTSNLIFELYENQGQKHSIKLRYNGVYKKIPFCDWQMSCPVQKYYQWYENFKDQKFLSTCGVYDKDVQTYFSIAAAEFIILLAIVLGVLVGYLKKNMAKYVSSNSSKNNNIANHQEQQNNQSQTPNKMIKESLLSEQ